MVDVCDFGLIDCQISEVFSHHKGLESQQFFLKGLPDLFVMRVFVTFPNFAPVVNEPIRLNLYQLGTILAQEPYAGQDR